MKNKNVNRRDFIRLSATAGAGALLVPNTAAATATATVQSANRETAFEIPVRTLGKTGLQIPILSMGVMRADNPNIVRAAYSSGITHFDTAHGYQNGKNEEMLGNFFKDKPRDSFTIATKGKLDYPLKDTFEKDYTELLELSLKRLQMDFVEIFYTHALERVEEVTDKRIVDLLLKFKADGKIKNIGLSTHANKPELIDAAIETGIYDVILVSYNFKLNNLKEMEEAIDRGVKAGIGFVAMKTMTGGAEDAEGKNRINGKACLKWAWKNENITMAIPGFTNFDLLDDCMAAAKSPQLTAEDKEYLAMLCGKELLYCQQCGKCTDECAEHLPIPDLMRAYMYAYGYKNASLSKETLQSLTLADDACKKCEKCKVSCISGFNVSEKIAAITPVRNIPDVFLT
ncbi:MAG: aldo/keto reductase [Tannerellaceae bacterium]|jgi:predicted aldo/keto reductase-like oxidoreductase|nr:aldo/keto reductase [Tannerellaceae bacterium]